MEYPAGSGITRYYAVTVPPNLAASPALVIVLHGTTYGPATAPVTYKDLGWIATSALPGHGNIVVTPSGTRDPHFGYWIWNAQFFDHSVFFGPGPYPDDIGFLRQLILKLTAQFNVNPRKVFAVGHSSGGFMAHRVARDLSDLVTAVAVSAGTLDFQSGAIPVPPVVNPVSILEFHGTADPSITPCSGSITWNSVPLHKATVDDTFNYWTSQNSCRSFTSTVPLCSGFTNNDATFCNGGAEIRFVWEPGLGHVYLTTNNLPIWNFFVAHSTPAVLSPATLAFGNVVVGVQSPPQTATLQNNLVTPLNVSNITTSGDYAILSNTCGTQIQGLASCQIVVTLMPKAVGSRPGVLTVTDSATPSQLSVALTGTGVAVKAVSLAVVPATPTIPKTTKQQFRALEGFNNGATSDVTSTVAWSSSAPGVASISTSGATKGLATGLAVGATTIAAKLTIPALTGSTTLAVSPAPLTSITVSPGTASVAAGLNQQFSALARFADGSTQDVTALAGWSSTSASVASIGPTGLATTTTPGTTNIVASIGTVSGSAALTVNPAVLTSISVTPGTAAVAAGLTQQFLANGSYTNGTTKDVSALATWSSSNAALASVGATGLATTSTTGIVTIQATLGTVSGSATLTVNSATLTSVSISPGTAAVAAGLTQQFSAAGTYTDGSTRDVSSQAVWSSSNPAAASVGSAGLAATIATGMTSIGASVGAQSASAQLTVGPAALASMTVSPSSGTIGVGSNLQYTATGVYTDGTTKNLTGAVAWTTDAPAVATIDGFGLGTVVGNGLSNILATAGAITGSAVLNGSNDPVTCDARIQDMQVLLVTSGRTESNYPAITQALDYFGTPYTVFDTTAPGAQITPQFLANGCHGFFQGVIYALGDYRYSAVTGQANVDSFEQAFQVRHLNWNFNFSNGPDFGLTPVTTITANTTPTPATY